MEGKEEMKRGTRWGAVERVESRVNCSCRLAAGKEGRKRGDREGGREGGEEES